MNMLEEKINDLIVKHDKKAKSLHEEAELKYNRGEFDDAAEVDRQAHHHETFSAELRLVLK